MIIKKVKIENFRLLKDLEIDFSYDKIKNLTVIRAANESGKTTLLYALQWGLFGNTALPNKNWRLSPLDALGRVKVAVSIDFFFINSRDKEQHFTLTRQVVETIGTGHSRSNEKINLFKVSDVGVDEVEYAAGWLAPHLPEDLKEIFFTDGDRALSFIEGSDATQSKKVEGAIRSLLGLEMIESAESHTRDTVIELNRKVRSAAAASSELEEVSNSLINTERELPSMQEELRTVEGHLKAAKSAYAKADTDLQSALERGNREKLATELRKARDDKGKAEAGYLAATKRQSLLFQNKQIDVGLLSKEMNSAFSLLSKLHASGEIPNSAVPVIKDRLKHTTCFCGSSIDVKTPDGANRREELQKLIERNVNKTEIIDTATNLYFSAEHILSNYKNNDLHDLVGGILSERHSAQQDAAEAGSREADIEAQIKQIPAVDVSTLRKAREEALKSQDLQGSQRGHLHSRIARAEADQSDLASRRNRLLNADTKGQQLLAELNVANDLSSLLKKSLLEIKEVELAKVSDLMNSIFLEMIGAAEEESQAGIIRKAEITSNFKILVHGSSDTFLDPSNDLNGASRRALTIAFIMALTQVSGVTAPNVIDTPLGMTSGYVKNSILKLACQNSSQLVMLLTHDEIKGCEGLIDKYAGVVTTITNPAHYPKILVNDPQTSDIRVIQCRCNHRSECKICERRQSGETV